MRPVGGGDGAAVVGLAVGDGGVTVGKGVLVEVTVFGASVGEGTTLGVLEGEGKAVGVSVASGGGLAVEASVAVIIVIEGVTD